MTKAQDQHTAAKQAMIQGADPNRMMLQLISAVWARTDELAADLVREITAAEKFRDQLKSEFDGLADKITVALDQAGAQQGAIESLDAMIGIVKKRLEAHAERLAEITDALRRHPL